MAKDHSDSKRRNLLLPHGLFFLVTSKLFYMHHPTDRIAYTTAFVMPGMKNSSIGPPWGIDLMTHQTMSGCFYNRATSHSLSSCRKRPSVIRDHKSNLLKTPSFFTLKITKTNPHKNPHIIKKTKSTHKKIHIQKPHLPFTKDYPTKTR